MSKAAGDNPYTRGIASYVANLRYEDIPPEVLARVKLLMLDALGCGIYGCLPQHSRILLDTLKTLDDDRTCGIWGTRERLSAPHATLATGSFIQGFELDDVWLLCEDPTSVRAIDATRRMSLAGKDLAIALGFKPAYVLASLSQPVDGHCYKTCTGLIPRY